MSFISNQSKRIAKFQANLFTKNILKKALIVPFHEQYAYILSLGKPKDDIERMILKHKCQMYYSPWLNRIMNISSFFLIPLLLLFLLFRKAPKNRVNKELVYLDCANLKEVIPAELGEIYSNSIVVLSAGCYMLKCQDLFLIFKLLRKYKIQPYLLFRLIMKIATYRYILEKFCPKAIAITNEMSPTSAAMTYYCELHDIIHVNFMHGEKLFTMNEAFNHFHKFYVFDEFYKNNFILLQTSNLTSFVVYTPPKFLIHKKEFELKSKIVDFTYYLEDFDEIEIKKIRDTICILDKKGYSVRVRPHPRFNDDNLMKRYIPEKFLEDTSSFSIEQSICSCRNIISVRSAILYQAQKLGMSVVLDDVNYKDMLQNLKDKMFIVMCYKYNLLSDYICKNEI